MSSEIFDPRSISFEKKVRASSSVFSIVIPDEWTLLTAKSADERPFVAYPKSVSQEKIEAEGEYSSDGIFYCSTPDFLDDEMRKTIEGVGIPEFIRARTRISRDSDANPTSSSIKKIKFVRTADCYVMVALVDTNAGISAMSAELGEALSSLKSLLGELGGEAIAEGYEIHIIPCLPFSIDYVRLFFPNQHSKSADAAFEKACEMAATIEVAEPFTCDLLKRLEKCENEVVDTEFFTETANELLNVLAGTRDLERKPADERFTREIKQAIASGEITDPDQIPSPSAHTINFFSDFSSRTIGYASDLLNAFQFQKEHGASDEDLRKMIESIGDFMILYETNLSDDDPKTQAEIDALGNIHKPAGYDEIRDMIEKELPGYKASHDEKNKDAANEETGNAPDSTDRAISTQDEGEAYSTWWEPFPKDREPFYGGYNQKFDHAAACWLLWNDVLFFNDDEISWDGHHHVITGIQANALKMDEVPVLIERKDNYIPAFVDFMTTIEQDEGLIIPRDMIHPVTQNALREGDLTGITLLNLQACAMALMVKQTAPDRYEVLADPRVTAGIPDFLNLMGRLIWDMREYNGVKEPFSVTILGARNFDANVFFGDRGFLDDPVPGAATELSGTFTSRPSVTLPSAEEIEEARRPFESGFDNPDEMQSDENLFETSLLVTAREFPLVVSIEGTHFLGRADRIENIKVGDKLVLASDWDNKWFTPCCIEVFNERGETLGNLNEQFSISCAGNRELALLLPYITATVESVTPLSQRRKSAKYALLDVRMELDESAVPAEFGPYDPEIVAKAKDILRLPKRERITISKSNLSPTDLKGCIDTSGMGRRKESSHIESNPSQEEARRAEAEAKQKAAEAEAKRRAEEEAAAKQEAEAKRKAEEEAEAKRKAEGEAKQKAEEKRNAGASIAHNKLADDLVEQADRLNGASFDTAWIVMNVLGVKTKENAASLIDYCIDKGFIEQAKDSGGKPRYKLVDKPTSVIDSNKPQRTPSNCDDLVYELVETLKDSKEPFTRSFIQTSLSKVTSMEQAQQVVDRAVELGLVEVTNSQVGYKMYRLVDEKERPKTQDKNKEKSKNSFTPSKKTEEYNPWKANQSNTQQHKTSYSTSSNTGSSSSKKKDDVVETIIGIIFCLPLFLFILWLSSIE